MDESKLSTQTTRAQSYLVRGEKLLADPNLSPEKRAVAERALAMTHHMIERQSKQPQVIKPLYPSEKLSPHLKKLGDEALAALQNEQMTLRQKQSAQHILDVIAVLNRETQIRGND